MIHHSCDRCQKIIDPRDDIRYVVRIEVQASIDPVDQQYDQDRDHLLELEEIIERLECEESDEFSDSLYQRQRHDLCSNCYREYMRNPLSTRSEVKFGFSEN